jgi:acetate kinase
MENRGLNMDYEFEIRMTSDRISDIENRIVEINKELNSKTRSADVMLSTENSQTKVMVITTDEELVIAMDTVRLS